MQMNKNWIIIRTKYIDLYVHQYLSIKLHSQAKKKVHFVFFCWCFKLHQVTTLLGGKVNGDEYHLLRYWLVVYLYEKKS